MAILDRDIYLRNHIMGVLASYSAKGLNYSNMAELADSLTEAVIEGDRAWQAENCCVEIMAISGNFDEDVPQ